MASNTTAHSEVPAQHSGGMPQLDFTTYPSQIFWLVIALVLLFTVMKRIVLPAIGGVIEERQESVANDLAKAGEFKRKAEEARGAYEKALAEARRKAQEIADQTRAEIKAKVDAETARADAMIAARVAESEKSIAAIRDSAAVSVREVALDVASALVAAVSPKAVDPKAIAEAVQAKLK